MVVFLRTCSKLLTKSLCSSEDFLRSLSLTFPLGFRSYESFGLTGAPEYVRPYAPIMAITVLAVLCLLGCGFLPYVLVQWIRETSSKSARWHPSANQTGRSSERKGLRVISSPRSARRSQFTLAPYRSQKATDETDRGGPSWIHAGRLAYRRIARSLSFERVEEKK